MVAAAAAAAPLPLVCSPMLAGSTILMHPLVENQVLEYVMTDGQLHVW